ncbi:MAG TPA: GNVR domain-containing protein, partial [Candidatus Brocadiaceae bacterium]
LPVANVPGAALELARLTRDVKAQEALFILLTQQLEQAKINEVKDTPVFQILDRAVPAERKSTPKTLIMTGLGGFMSIFLGIFIILFLEYLIKQFKKSRQARCLQ